MRHPIFRMLWTANVVTALGTWMQNTGAGWLMTSLSPDALSVSLVQAATIVPTFLLALPAGALADTVDRRHLMIGCQIWTMLAAVILALLTYAHAIDAAGLIALTFAIGIGTAMYQPAWGATVPEVVPRHDLVQAIALNGIGFNLARALGPALGGVLVLFGGPALAFLLFAVSFLASLAALFAWRRRKRRSSLPPEHLISAMRAGMQFVRHTPAMRAAIVRSAAYFMPAAAPWAMLPLIVREQLGLGAGSFGLLLGLMGVGGVTAGMLLPRMRGVAGRGTIVFGSTLFSAAGMACIAATHHWAPAAVGMFLFGIGWVSAASTTQAAAQLVAPPWVRARALAIYQLAFNGALAFGSMMWGGVGDKLGLQPAMLIAAILAALLAVAVRGYGLDSAATTPAPAPSPPEPEAPAPELASQLPGSRGRILETMRYHVAPRDRAAFLEAMAEVQHVRGRAGAMDWRLYEDVAHPEGWLEVWSMQNWTDHLREAIRLSEEDKRALAAVGCFRAEDAPLPCRYLAVDPRLEIATQRGTLLHVGAGSPKRGASHA
ncbi:MAG TPA: MFS transporter [Acetobacteraceae bacterium]|jgi:MFS family permease|nr:MFS transporter [Acetobacteraceae bacterium]